MSGRLGNQLFQWAYAHQLSSHFNVKITPIYDAKHEHKNYESNLYELINPCKDINPAQRNNSIGIGLAILDKISSFSPRASFSLSRTLRVLRMKDFDSIPILPKTAPRLVTGFFINHLSLKGIREEIASELNVALSSIEMPPYMNSKYQVIHVRRGDFNALRNSYGVLSIDYYLKNMLNDVETYICTDDEELVPDLVKRIQPQRVFGPNDLGPFEVLKLMSKASHVLMSNSTLSWWGGFLCVSNNGKATLPKPYYRFANREFDAFDYPEFQQAEAFFED